MKEGSPAREKHAVEERCLKAPPAWQLGLGLLCMSMEQLRALGEDKGP